MTTFNKFKQQLNHALYLFFDIEESKPEKAIALTHNTQGLIDQVNQLTQHPQTVTIQICVPTNSGTRINFLVGKFQKINTINNDIVFILDDSNVIQLLPLKQIIKIAA